MSVAVAWHRLHDSTADCLSTVVTLVGLGEQTGPYDRLSNE